MEIMPGYTQTFPLPPPPQRSHKGLWIGLAIGAVVLCLCGILVVGVYFFGPNIPYISSFFPSPTPTGLFYNNPAAGISLTYPVTWQYSESGDATYGYSITFASSTDILTAPSRASETGAAMMIGTIILTNSNLPFTVNASSMEDAVNGFANLIFTNISQNQNLRTFTLSGYPAASGVYTVTSDTSSPTAVYITAVLRDDAIILFVGLCPQTEWTQHQPTFDSIVNSASIFTP
jgi:hypothetical protein